MNKVPLTVRGAELLKEARAKAVEKLEQAYRAVMAMEGTLGADISDNMRALNSWMMTYQNFRLLSTTLFSSFADVVGLVVNGGELGDAWDAFVTGIKEVKLGWGNKKSQDNKAQRAEMWGTVDAGSTLDALGQTYGSVFLTGAARRMSNALFKWNGMEVDETPLTLEQVYQIFASLSPGVEDGSGWVKVEDRLPENAGWVNDTVMFWSKKHGHALIGCYDFEFDDWTQQPWTEGAEKLKSSDVTHWRPLPTPPGVEDNQTKKQ